MLSFVKKVTGPASEIAVLRSQLETAKRRITALMLDNIQLANEIVVLQDYRGELAPENTRPMLMVGREMSIPAAAANSEIGHLFSMAAG